MSVKCPKCHSDNTNTASFCCNCAALLPSTEDLPVSRTKTLKMPAKRLSRETVLAVSYEIIEELGKGFMGEV